MSGLIGFAASSAYGDPLRTATPNAYERALHLVAEMHLDEKILLLHTRFGTPTSGQPAPPDALMSAGVAPGVARLGIPPLEETDAGLGIADPANILFNPTAMPSGLAIGATFDPALAERVGAAVGSEARARGLGVVLGGGADLVREPRGGRNFEYVSEDPLLTGVIAGADIRGVQSARIVCTLKHFALNDQENGRVMYSARLGEAAARESDLLAFEIALETGRPGAMMTSYNRVDGTWASQNAHLLTDVLKGDWRFGGWVLSDWGGVHSTVEAALAGLDQESGEENDRAVYFGAPLAAAVRDGRVPQARIDDMLRRQLAARIAAGLFDDPPRRGPIRDRQAHAALAERAAGEAIVLLKNERGVLPLAPGLKRILLVGRMADRGVLSGGGSSQVVPDGAIRADGEPKRMFYGQPKLYDPSSPLDALRESLPGTIVDFVDGSDVDAAIRAAQWRRRRRDRRRAMVERIARSSRPRFAARTGCVDRRGGRRQPAHDRGAADWRPRDDALARRRAGGARSLVSRRSRRPRHRRHPERPRRPLGPAAPDLPGRRDAAAAPGAARP